MRCQDKRRRLLWVLVHASLWLSATAMSQHLVGADDLSDLQSRAARFWHARVQDDWRTVYDLMPPEDRSMAGDRDAFATYQREKGPIRYSSASIEDVVADKNLGWVRVKFSSRPRLYAKLEPSLVDTWQVWQKRDDWRPVARTLLGQFPTRPPKTRPGNEETALAARIDEEWKALQANDWARIYDLLDAASRVATPRDTFLARKARYVYLKHTIEWTEVTEDRGRAKVTFTRKLNDPMLYKLDPEDATAFENWSRVDGQWFRRLDEPSKGGR
jgi:hypothetical protein